MYVMRVKCLGSTTLLDGEKREHRNYGRQKVSLLHTPVICSPDSPGDILVESRGDGVGKELGPERTLEEPADLTLHPALCPSDHDAFWQEGRAIKSLPAICLSGSNN